MSTTRRPWLGPGALLGGSFVAAIGFGGCHRDWDAYDPRLGSGGHATGSSSTSSSTGGPLHCGGTNVLAYDFPGSDPGEIWSHDVWGAATVVESGGEGVVTLPSGSTAGSRGAFRTNRSYDLRGDSISVEVTQAGNTATTVSADFLVGLGTSGNSIQIYQKSGKLYCIKQVDGSWTSLKSISYSPTDHLYWRFREDGVNTYWETSGDGATWVVQAQVATSTLFPLDIVQIQLVGATDGGEINPGSVHFAKLNGGGPPAGQWCPASSITDDFSSSIRSPIWNRSYVQSPETVAQAGGLLVFTLAPNAAAYAAYVSSASYDLTGSSVVVHVPQSANPATSGQTAVILGAPGSSSIQMVEEKGQIVARLSLSGASQDLGSTPYVPAAHAWWRIRESGGTLYWEAAPDGKTWAVLQQTSPYPFPITVLDVSLLSGTYLAEASPGSSAYDSLNVPPP